VDVPQRAARRLEQRDQRAGGPQVAHHKEDFDRLKRKREFELDMNMCI